jgi:exonuclease III
VSIALPTVVTEWFDVRVLSTNVNSIPANSHALIEHHLSKFHISSIQETKFPDPPRWQGRPSNTIQSKFQAKLFSNDQNSQEPQTQFPRSGGAMTMIQCDFPEADTAVIEQDQCIANRYQVIKLQSAETSCTSTMPAYVPNAPSEKKMFFESLPTDFEPDAHTTSSAVTSTRRSTSSLIRPGMSDTTTQAKASCCCGSINFV